jgi:hypothetical protein
MIIKQIHDALKLKGLEMSSSSLWGILSGKRQMSFSTALKLTSMFPEKDLLQWKHTKREDVKSFLIKELLHSEINSHKDVVHRKIKKIRYKYGDELFKDLKNVKMSGNPYFNLSTVAEKYGFSREYAGQIYAMIYKKRFKKSNPIVAQKEITCVHNPKRKIADWKKSGPQYQGAVTEKLFMCRCELLGFDVKIPCSPGVDIIVNGYLIDVKTSNSPRKIKGGKIKYLGFNISKEQRSSCHFFACYSETTDDFYIIPNEEHGGKFKKTRRITIAQTPSHYCNAKNKYIEFKNRFDLLTK